MSTRFTAALAALLATLALLAVAPLAGAASKHPTTLFVSEKYPAFHGSISSEAEHCLGGRLVVVKRQLSGKLKTVGVTYTNAAGKWKVKVNLTSGEYWVTVPSHLADCGGVRSEPMVVD